MRQRPGSLICIQWYSGFTCGRGGARGSMVAAQHALLRVHPVGRRHRSVDPSWTRPAASRPGRSRGRAAPRLSSLVFGLTVCICSSYACSSRAAAGYRARTRRRPSRPSRLRLLRPPRGASTSWPRRRAPRVLLVLLVSPRTRFTRKTRDVERGDNVA